MGRKITKKILRITLWIIGSLLALDLIIVGLLFVPPIQQKVVDKVTSILSEKWHSRISIGEVYLSPSMKLYAKDFAIYDYRDNKMIAAGQLETRLTSINFSPFQLSLSSSELDHVRVIIRKYAGAESVNIAIWAKNFKKKEKKSPFSLDIPSLHLKHTYFLYVDDNKRIKQVNNDIDFAFFELKDIDWSLKDFKVVGADISGKFEHLSFAQYTGFQLLNLSGDFRINKEGLTLNNALVLTPNSHVFMDFAFKYTDWKDYSDFVNKIKFIVTTKTSTVGMKDITYFAPKLRGMNNTIILNCQVDGVVNNLNINNLEVKYKDQTYLAGSLNLKDITNFKHAFFHAHLSEIEVNMNELASFLLPNGKQIPLPDKIKDMETATVDFDFTGTLAEFSTRAEINSQSDNLVASLNAVADSNDMIVYDGAISTSGFNLGQFLPKLKLFGQVVVDATISGTAVNPNKTDNFLQTVEAGVTAKIARFDIKGYPLHNIKIDGNYAYNRYDAALSIRDPNCMLKVEGDIDRLAATPHYEVAACIDHFFPNKMFKHLRQVDTTSAKGFDKFIAYLQKHDNIALSADTLGFSLYGDDWQHFTGNVFCDKLSYQQQNEVCNSERLRLVLVNDGETHIYRFTSDILNANLSTNYSLRDMLSSVMNMAYRYCPNLLPEREEQLHFAENITDNQQFLDIEATLFDAKPLLKMFLPNIQIADGTSVRLSSASNQETDFLSVYSPNITINQNVRINELVIKGNQTDSAELDLSLLVKSLKIGKDAAFAIHNIDLQTILNTDSLNFDLTWQNPDLISIHESNIGGVVLFPERKHILAQITSSDIFVKDYLWKFNPDNLIELHDGTLAFHHVELAAEQSKILVDGWVNNRNDSLIANIDNVDIDVINRLFEGKNISLGGMLSANVRLRNIQNERIIFGSVLAKDFQFNKENFGNLFLSAALPTGKDVQLRGGIINPEFFPDSISASDYRYRDFMQQQGITTRLSGKYSIKQKEFQITADVDTLPLGFLSPFLASFSHKIVGNASGKINFVLNTDSMYFDGNAFVKNAQLGIRPLNTIYDIKGQVIGFNPEGLTFNDVVVNDKYGNQAALTGYIHHQKFKNFDMNLNIHTDKFLVLNTSRTTDAPFYGDGFVSGDVSINGNTKRLSFSGSNLKTQSGTKFYLPISFADKVSESNVISFKSAPRVDSVENDFVADVVPESDEMEMDFDFTFDVTPIAKIQLDLDLSAFGGSIETKGEGKVHFTYNTKSDINILGDVKLHSGSFMMNFTGIINKKFELLPGGNVNFDGSLDDININVQAQYSTNASLSDLIVSDNLSMRKVPVKTFLRFSGNLSDPASIDFGFDLPNSGNELKNLFYSSIDTTNMQSKTQQFFSLVMLGKFLSSTKSMMEASSIESTGIDFLTSTFSNFVSQQLKYVDLDFGYQNADAEHSAQYSVAASTSLFNDRTIIEGYFGYVDDKNANSNNSAYTQVIGDFSIEQKLNELGTWRVKIFNVTNQDELRYSNNNSPYAQGVAVIYKQDFNNRKDLAESFKRKNKRVKKRQNEQKQ